MSVAEPQPAAPKPRIRWFHLTPDRLILALLAAEALLLLAERFGWFGFDAHKGWPVLIAIAAVGVVMFLMLLWFAVALLFRWRFQFGIRSLLVLTVAVAIPFSWLAVEVKKAKEQKEAVEEIDDAGGRVDYDYQTDSSGVFINGAIPPAPTWLRNLVGDDMFVNAKCVALWNPEASDTRLAHLKMLTSLQWFLVSGDGPADQVNHACVEYLKGLTHLESVYVDGSDVSDAGLEDLKGLTALKVLDIGISDVSDAGLEHLKGLTQLQKLDLSYTKVSDAGVKKLQRALPNCKIKWTPPTKGEQQNPAAPDQPGG